MEKTRVEELLLFCRELGFRRLGVAFCIGLAEEARVLCEYLRPHFTVYSDCKVCGVSKDDYGLEKIDANSYEAMCNPLAQPQYWKRRRPILISWSGSAWVTTSCSANIPTRRPPPWSLKTAFCHTTPQAPFIPAITVTASA